MIRATLADAVVKTLQDEQMEVTFGICGGYLLWLLRAFDQAGVRTIPSRHEGAAAFAAAGYTQASGKLGVVFGQGPGVMNMATGVACAYHDSTPMLVLASQAPQDQYGADAHQEATGSNLGVDQIAAFTPMTRAAFRCPTAPSSIRALRRALAIAHARHGPVMIEIPANLLAERVELDPLEPRAYRSVPRAVDPAGIAETVELVANANRPILIIGNRATHRGIAEELRALCEETRLPFAVVDFAKGIIPEDHPLYVGVVGWCGHASTHEALAAADLVIALGVRFDSKATVNYQQSLFPNLVQIDEEAAEIGRNFPVRLGMIADIPATVRALRAELRARGITGAEPDWIASLHERHRTYDEPIATEPHEGLRSAAAMHVLRRRLPRQALLVGDSGLNLHYLKRFFPIYQPDGFYCLYGWAAMGSGVPLAIGVQVGRPDDVVVCVIGDGGLLVHVGELQIMAEYKLPIVIVVLNNAGYHSVRSYMSRFMNTDYGCGIDEIDAARIAESFGCDGYTARSPQELARAVDAAVVRRRPAVIDVKVSGDRLEDVLLPGVERMVSTIYARDA